MKNLRAFKILTLQATNTKPNRIKITDLRYDKSIIISYIAEGPSEQNERVREFLSQRGIEIVAQAWREIGGKIHDYTLLFTENFDKQIK